MSVIQGAVFEDSGYQIQRSLRLRASATAYLSRTFTTPTNALKFTYSVWVKRGTFGGIQMLMGCGNVNTGTSFAGLYFDSSDRLYIFDAAPSSLFSWVTTRVFRDPSAWTHIFLSVDKSTTAAQLWINGVSVTGYADQRGPTNAVGNFNSAVLHTRGKNAGAADGYFDGYRAEEIYVDGQYFSTPANFGQFDPTTGQWTAKKYTGTYGANGDYTPFSDNTALTTASNVGLGKDLSGNGNYWVTNNVSITAGATYDSMLDVPLAAGTTDRGNFAVMNPLSKYSDVPMDRGNLQVGPGPTGTRSYMATVAMTQKTYAEVELTLVNSGNNAFGISLEGVDNRSYYISGQWLVRAQEGNFYASGVTNPVGPFGAISQGSIGIIAFDPATGKLWLGAGGVWFNSGNPAAGTGAVATVNSALAYFLSGATYNDTQNWNFGQRPFTYTPPTGFKALHTGNLPAPVIQKPNKHFDVSTYTGNGTSQSITSAQFQPDFVWVKERSGARDHRLVDSVRGATKELYSNLTFAEATDAVGLTSFNSNGYSLGSSVGYNANGVTEVGWLWKAGGAAVTNTAGSISAQVSANPSAGFSIVTYTGTGANATVGHGLGVAPKMVIVKARNVAGQNHVVFHNSFLAADHYMYLNDTQAVNSAATLFNTTRPASSVFSVGTNAQTNGNATTYVAYCFAEIAGYSKFGSYTGNGSADGPFVYCGFRPRYVMVKNTTTAATDWLIYDAARDTFNVADDVLLANASTAEQVVTGIDITANGFKVRQSGIAWNGSGNTLIFAAFAEAPFQSALAR